MPETERCVRCRQRPVDPRWRPFCSDRCRNIDLGRWLSGDYRIAGRHHSAAHAGPHAAEPDDLDHLGS